MTKILFGISCTFITTIVVLLFLLNEGEKSTENLIQSTLWAEKTNQQFAQPVRGTNLIFPKDHGAHEDFRHEWWYFTGNLRTETDREFGYQLTFFRFAHKKFPEIENTWNNDQTWLAHFAVSDIHSKRFYFDQELTRQSLELAGASSRIFHVWLNNWKAKSHQSDCENCLSLRLFADSGDFSIDLEAQGRGLPVLQGDNGYSPKNQSGTAASFYYSYPNLVTSGEIRIRDQKYAVNGLSWMDREWLSGILQRGQLGWDWFAFHLNDDRKIMLFQVRQEDQENYRHAVLIETNRTKVPLEVVKMHPIKNWKSPATKVKYPIEWELVLDSSNSRFELELKSLMRDQEIDLVFRYYEGAMEFTGVSGGKNISGRGYMELTGY